VPYAAAGTIYKAAYKVSASGTNKCECPCADMYYDASAGMCRDCDVSTPNQFATACGATSCTAGYELGDRVVASNGICAAGYELGDAVERSCETGIGPSSCKAGFELETITSI
jgi:hypothetical protein